MKHTLRSILALLILTVFILLITTGCEFVDRRPTAIAGTNLTGFINELVTIDGSGSQDPDGRGLTDTWSFSAKPAASLLSNNSLVPAGTLQAVFTPDTVGTYIIRLQVADGTYTEEDFTVVEVSLRPAAPGTPVNFTCFNIGDRSVSFKWDTVTGADSYVIYRDTSSTGSFVTSVYNGSNTMAVDTGLTPESIYYYKIQAVNAHGASAFSTIIAGTTVAVIVRLPGIPIDPAVGKSTDVNGYPTATSLTVLWDAPEGAESYTAYRSTVEEGPFTNDVYTGTSLVFVDAGLSSGTRYYYRIVAKNLAGSSDPSITVNGLTKPAPPGNMEVSAPTASTLNLSWDNSTGASSYTIYRSASESGTYSIIGTTAALELTDTSCSSGTTYYYKIKSENSSGLSIYSAGAQGLTLPGKPSMPTVTTGTNASLSIDWDHVTGSTSYTLYRSAVSDFTDSVSIYTGAADSYADTGLTGGSTYYYRVVAENSSGKGSVSEILTALTRPDTPGPLMQDGGSTSSVILSWDAVSGATRYYLYRDTSSTGTFSTQIYSGTDVGHTDTGRNPGTTYYYKIKAENGSGYSTLSGVFTFWTYSLSPTIPVLDSKTATSVTLTWSSQTGTSSYTVYRSDSISGSYTEVGTTAATTFTDTSLSSGTIYYYKIASVNPAGESPSSAALGVTTL